MKVKLFSSKLTFIQKEIFFFSSDNKYIRICINKEIILYFIQIFQQIIIFLVLAEQ